MFAPFHNHQSELLELGMNFEWIDVKKRLPKCSKVRHSFGVPVLVYPPFAEGAGYSASHQAFYGCRQTDKPNFYIYGVVFHPEYWAPIPEPPALVTTGQRRGRE